MHKLLIPLLICLTATFVHAQVPQNISISTKSPVKTATPDAACFGGTITPGPFFGQSNDIDLDTIFLCHDDSIFINHNGNQMFMDPDPTTNPAVGYAFYNCMPTATGDLPTVLGDACVWPGAVNGLWVTTGPPGTCDGDMWFINNGNLIASSIFGMNNPVQIWFAPITIDDCANQGFEGGCVDVNTAAKFSVVYLKPITEFGLNGNSSVNTNYTNDCKGRFRPRGGYPEWNLSATYTVEIFLTSNPAVKALIYTPPAQMKHGTDVVFSVPQAGVYTVIVEDGKSCGHTFQVNMNVCTPADNVGLSMPEVVAAPGTNICIPITVDNFLDITGASFSLEWDPTVLQFTGIQNASDSIQPFSIANGNLNTLFTGQGFLGMSYNDGTLPFEGASIPNGQTFVEVCFDVIAPVGPCTTLEFGSFPTLVTMDDFMGAQLAITPDTGQVCVDFIPLVANFFVCPPLCDNTASIAAVIEAGAPQFSVTWRQLPGGSTLSVGGITTIDTIKTNPLPEGTWEVCVIDGTNAQVCDTLVVSVPSLGATLSVVQLPLCNGGNDGVVEAEVSIDGVVVPSPGWPEYSFQWNGAVSPPQDTLPLVNGVFAGNYTVIVTNNSTGCTALASGTLSQPAALDVANTTITPASCSGVADGAISVTATGGTPFPGNEYFYAWTYSPNMNGIPIFSDEAGNGNPTFSVTNKPSGFYFLTVTDGNGCTLVQTAKVQIPDLRVMTLDTIFILNPTCLGLSTGCFKAQLNASPTITNGNYLHFLNPGGGTQTDAGNMVTYCDLPAGTYNLLSLEVTTGCSDTASFVLKDPPALSVSTAPIDPSCLVPNSGNIAATGTGGTGPYTFAWASDPFIVIPPGPVANALPAGTYTVTVTDASGCTSSATQQLVLPPPPAITSIDSTSVKCGADGTLKVNAPTGVSFTWTTLSNTNVGNTAQVTGLPGDTYIVTVRDAMGCQNSDTVTLAPVAALFFADTLLQIPTCFGDCDGSIAIDVQGGTNPKTYAWSSAHNGSVILPLCAGTYTVTVTDGNQCTKVGIFTLDTPPQIVIQYNNIAPATCPSTCDGKVEVIASYGSIPPTFPNFSFLWEDTSTDPMRTDLCPGYNTLTITDPQKGCFRIDSLLIGSPPAFDVTIDSIPTTCFGDNNGEATATVSGGNGFPYSYNWSTTPPASTAHVIGLMAGQYTLTVQDAKGCTEVFATTIDQPDQIVVTLDLLTTENPMCYGQNNGELAVAITGGNGNFTYQWANSAGANIGSGNPLPNLSAGNYSVTVTDQNGCTGVLLNAQLLDPPAVLGQIAPIDPILCHGDETTLSIDTIFGGAGEPYQYSLDFGVFIDPDFPVAVSGGEHYVTYADRNGCEYTDTIFVAEPQEILVTFDPSEFEIELGDTTYQLLPIVTGAVVDSFIWTPAAFLSNPDTLEPYVFTFESTKYTLVVYDEKGCSATGVVTINVDPNRNVYLPNVVFPGNPRGLNDHFNPIVGLGVEGVNFMRIYDRWGSLMYERNNFYPDNNNFAEGWDGKYRGDYVNPGVFVYVIEVKFFDGRVLTYRGDLTVVR